MLIRKVICPDIGKLEIRTFDVPDKPGPHEILVKTVCSTISCGTELAVYGGTHIGYSIPNAPFPKLPWSAGYASAGIVDAVGEDVENVKVGDRIAIITPHADASLCDIRKTVVRKLPANVSFEEGALSRIGGISLLAVLQARLALGETAVVYGLGLIGMFAALLARINGARPVIGIDIHEERLKIAEKCGIKVIHAANEDVAQQVLMSNFGNKPEVVIDSTGDANNISDAIKLVADGGRYIELGSPRGKSEIDVYSTLHRNGIWLTGVHDRLAPMTQLYPNLYSRPRNLGTVIGLFADGSLQSQDLITHRVKPDAIQDTYEALMNEPGKYLGVIIEWQ